MNTAIVFGGTGGIGKAICRELIEHNYILEIANSVTDIRDDDQVNDFVDQAMECFNRLDLVVCSVGYPITSSILDTTASIWDKACDVYINGLSNIVKAVAPIMQKQQGGYIINIGGLRAFSPAKFKGVYSTVKAAANAYLNVVQKEVEEYNIRVTTVHPGFTNTMFHGEKSKRPYTEDGKEIPIVQPEDIAKIVYMLTTLSHGANIANIKVGKAFDEGVRLLPCSQIKR